MIQEKKAANTATSSSEFVATKIYVEQTIDTMTILRYREVPTIGMSQFLCDNESVVNSSIKFHAKLYKQYNALYFHQVRESIAADICWFHHIHIGDNPADIPSKYW